MNSKKWKMDNPERVKIHSKRYRQKHKIRIAKYQKEYMKQWRKDNPDKMRKINKKKTSNRRGLGFNPSNKYFQGSEAHHLNRNDVVYMPQKLHQSISHCLKTGFNMGKINRLAMVNVNII